MEDDSYEWEVTWLCNGCGETFEDNVYCRNCPICGAIDIIEQDFR